LIGRDVLIEKLSRQILLNDNKRLLQQNLQTTVTASLSLESDQPPMLSRHRSGMNHGKDVSWRHFIILPILIQCTSLSTLSSVHLATCGSSTLGL